MKFLKQEIAVKTGLTLSQIECGAYSVDSNKPLDNYFAKDDSHLFTVECSNGWKFGLQRVDGTIDNKYAVFIIYDGTKVIGHALPGAN